MSAKSPVENAKSNLTFRLVSDLGELRALAGEWQSLLDRSASPEPMLAPAWLLTWWEVYGSGRELRVGVFHDGNQLVGLAPLCVRRFRHRFGLPFTRLELIGSDVDENDGVCSEYLNVIAQRGRERDVADALTLALDRGAFGPWHEVVFSAMDGTSAMPELLRDSFAGRRLPVVLQTVDQAPFLALPEHWDSFLRALEKKRRQNLVKPVRDLDAWAEQDWHLQRVESEAELERGWSILQELHNHRWQHESGTGGAFSQPRFQKFHQALLPQLLKQGQLELCWLVVRGRPIAVHYEIHANGKAYFYQCGRMLDLPNPQRPGAAMLSLAIQRAINKGLREFDFLGGTASYKLQITQTTRPILQLRAARPGLRESLRGGVELLVDKARKVKRALRS